MIRTQSSQCSRWRVELTSAKPALPAPSTHAKPFFQAVIARASGGARVVVGRERSCDRVEALPLRADEIEDVRLADVARGVVRDAAGERRTLAPAFVRLPAPQPVAAARRIPLRDVDAECLARHRGDLAAGAGPSGMRASTAASASAASSAKSCGRRSGSKPAT